MSTLPNLKRQNLVDVVFDTLHKRILSGELKNGETLPPQDVLAAQLGVSRTVLREAIKQLSSLGFVSSEQGRGTFVKIPDAKIAIEPVIQALSFDGELTIELIETRYFLESAIARMAAQRATPEQVAELEEIVHQMKESATNNNSQEWVKSDLNFHIKLGEMAGNKMLKQFLDTIRELTVEHLKKIAQIPSEVAISTKAHMAIVKAIVKKDPDLAEKKMQIHFNSIAKVLRKDFGYKLTL